MREFVFVSKWKMKHFKMTWKNEYKILFRETPIINTTETTTTFNEKKRIFCARVAKSNGCTSWNYKFQRVKQRERMRGSLLFLFVSVSSLKIHEILFVFFFVIIVPRLRLYVYLIKSSLTIIASLLISYHAFC